MLVRRLMAGLFCLTAFAGPAQAGEWRDGGKLLLTGGVTNIEGAAGGGLASWAFIAGNETDDGVGGSAHITQVQLDDFGLTTFGAAVGAFDRVEISYARQRFDTRAAGAALGLGRGYAFSQDVYGAKLRLVGDAVWDQDRILPQIAIGVQHKRANRADVIHALGGVSAHGTDIYVAATKVFLDRSLVIDGTIRLTKANQTGLLGFGGDRHSRYSPQFEGSAGMLVSRRLLIGAEYRTRPDNLGFAKEDDAFDVFAAFAATRNVAVTLAYADLGSIATLNGQRGLYLSLQTSF